MATTDDSIITDGDIEYYSNKAIIPNDYDKILNINNPNLIILVDSGVESTTIVEMNKIHKQNGLIMFAFHYFIDTSGKIYQGRLESMYASKTNLINNFNYSPDEIKEDEEKIYVDEIQRTNKNNVSWFYSIEPTTINEPYTLWTTTDLKNNHLNDLYYDIKDDNCYRFVLESSVYKWEKIEDTTIKTILKAASIAQDTTDGKRKTFTSKPFSPYDEGDLWINNDGDILSCITSRLKDNLYDISTDWLAIKYTDNTDPEIRANNIEREKYVDGIKIQKSNKNNLLRIEDGGRIETINKIYICLEGNTKISDINNDQYKSIIALSKNILNRNTNVKNIYGLSELIPNLNNPGIFLDMNKIRSESKLELLPVYVNTPSGNNTYTFGSRDFYYDEKNNISGNDIALYQTYLKLIGYPLLEVTGVYDFNTYNLSKQFQASIETEVNGIISTFEFTKLKSLIKTILSKNTNKYEFNRILEYRKGYKSQYGDDVKLIQQKLKDLLLYIGEINGKYSKEVMESVKSFQKLSLIPVDGKVGPSTFDMILLSENIEFTENIVYDPDKIEFSGIVKRIQTIIRNNTKKFGLTSVTVNGIYDKITYINIKKIQINQLLTPTGIIDKVLYEYLINI